MRVRWRLRELGLFIYSRMMRERDEQNEVYVVAEEGTHNERKCASGKREQEHVHGRRFVLGETVRKTAVSGRQGT